ncbi:extracellular solute-binding protein [Rhizobium sp. ICMP 5592]|uniref:ABC transporter substrate-binding protein n=1 Tax=Rhizobium sp. ICMP 5592 TaxID=2292445 RepID=UPI0012980428|nr:extracellular solute-binding protein [Rhizobium sp. ICMP 5592]MQB46475.1 extracellular solute-binding protein [Rhizobium sp. ICMP 5592]
MSILHQGQKTSVSRRTVLKGAAALSGVAVASSFFPAPAISATTEINVLSLGEGMFGQPFVDLSPEFTKATGIKVNNITMGYNEAIQKQVAAFAGGSSSYDVVQVDSIYLKGYAKAGHLLPLDDLIPADDLKDFFSDIPQTFKDMYGDDGKTYGMATIGNCQRLIYNKAHLDAVGLGVPQTWDDLLAASQKVVDPKANRFGFIAGTERLAKAFGVWLPIFWANGGVIFDDKMKPIFADQNGVDSLAFLLELVKTMPPGGAAYTEGDEVKAMATGLGTLDPVAWIPDAHVTADAKTKSELVSAVPPKGKVISAPVMGGLGLTVSKYCADPKPAAQFVAWFNSRDVQSSMIVQHGGQPCRNSAWEANATAKPWFPAVAASLKLAKVRPQIPEWSQVDSEVGVQLSRAFAGDISPKEALEAAQKSVDQIMQDAGYY